MLVDDHRLVRETWKMLLESGGAISVIRECDSGLEAIDCAPDLHPDIILMDINMSPINGFEATSRILEKSPRIKIIGISVNSQPGYARNIIEMGASGYVTKNSSREEMLTAIKEVLDGQTYICAEVRSKMHETQ